MAQCRHRRSRLAVPVQATTDKIMDTTRLESKERARAARNTVALSAGEQMLQVKAAPDATCGLQPVLPPAHSCCASGRHQLRAADETIAAELAARQAALRVATAAKDPAKAALTAVEAELAEMESQVGRQFRADAVGADRRMVVSGSALASARAKRKRVVAEVAGLEKNLHLLEQQVAELTGRVSKTVRGCAQSCRGGVFQIAAEH